MSQSRLMSFVESWANVIVGFAIGWVSNMVVLPWFGYKVSTSDAFLMSIIFTVISLIRSYVIRRWFNGFRVVRY